MKLALAEEMRQFDLKAQTEYKLSGDLLMERAALAAAHALDECISENNRCKVYICCGKGNNGGDGFALARILKGRGVNVTAVLLYPREEHSGLALTNLERAERFGVPMISWSDQAIADLAKADWIVDALLGTGTKGAPRGVIRTAIENINELSRPVLALDLPSGIDADTGAVPGAAIRAACTVTFGLGKPGLFIYPGAEFAGRVITDSIGFPPELLEDPALTIAALTEKEARALIPRRGPTAHKGTTGHVLVVGGSPGMTGAPALAALGALRSGCGLVTVGLRESLPFIGKPLEVMNLSWNEAMKRDKAYQAIVFGPGMSTANDGLEFLNKIMESVETPLVIDADGLNILADNLHLLSRRRQPIVLTPHPGEMARLTGLSTAEVQYDRIGIARKYSQEWQVTVILKGARTITALPDGRIYLNLTGNSAMATAGMGDLLAGMVGGLIAQGTAPEVAAILGPYLHGLAGDAVRIKKGPAGIIASDLLDEIPAVLKRVLTDEQTCTDDSPTMGRN